MPSQSSGASIPRAAQSVDQALTFGLLWLDRAQESSSRGVIAGLRLIVPRGADRILAHFRRALNSRPFSVVAYAETHFAGILAGLQGRRTDREARLPAP
jgi:hypothetical protein